MDATRQQQLDGWLRLARVPNLFTVPGDVIAGFALAGGLSQPALGSLALVIIVSLLLYIGGLFLNDWYDQEIDRRERPERPLPAGVIAPTSVIRAAAWAITLALASAATLGIAPFGVALLIAGMVWFYNAKAKAIGGLGVLVMAGCRALNVGLGASLLALPDQRQTMLVLLAIAVVGAYIWVVATIAVNEMNRLPAKGVIALVLLSPIVTLAPGIDGLSGKGCGGTWLVWSLFAVGTVTTGYKLWNNHDIHVTSRHVGALIRNVIFLQAFLIASTGASCYWIAAVALLWPAASIAGRWFYGS